MIELDAVMPAVLRPETLDRVLASFRAHLWGEAHVRLHVNIDPVGDGDAGEVERVCRRHVQAFEARHTARGSLNSALRWLWTRPGLRHPTLYMEDDVEMRRDIDLAKMIDAMRRQPKLGYLQLPWDDHSRAETRNTRNVRHLFTPGEPWDERLGKYRFALQPSLMAPKLMADLAGALQPSPDPEIQFQRGPCKEILHAWVCGAFAKPGDKRAIFDIGRQGSADGDWVKINAPEGTAWRRVRDFAFRGLRHRVADDAATRAHWDQVEAGRWRVGTYRAMDRFLREGDAALDIGAYAGALSLYMARRARRVLAFEPDPVARNLWAANVNLTRQVNGWPRDRLVMSDKAVVGAPGERWLEPMSGWASSRPTLATGEPSRAAVRVGGIRLDRIEEVYATGPIGYVKLITQGSEPEILAAAKGWLGERKPTLHVTVQPHFYADRRGGLRQVADALRGYRHVYDESAQRIDLSEMAEAAGGWATLGERILVATDRAWEARR